MAVIDNLPTISFEGLEIKPRYTALFVSNFNEQQRRLVQYSVQLNQLAVAVDQAVTDAEGIADAAVDSVESAGQAARDAIASDLTAARQQGEGVLSDIAETRAAAVVAVEQVGVDQRAGLATAEAASLQQLAAAETTSLQQLTAARALALQAVEQDRTRAETAAHAAAADAREALQSCDQAGLYAEQARAAAAADVINDEQLSETTAFSSAETDRRLSRLQRQQRFLPAQQDTPLAAGYRYRVAAGDQLSLPDDVAVGDQIHLVPADNWQPAPRLLRNGHLIWAQAEDLILNQPMVLTLTYKSQQQGWEF